MIEERLRPGGVLIIDNMIWHNRIFDANDQAPDTEGVRAVTQGVDDQRELDRLARSDPRRHDRRGADLIGRP